MVYSKHIQVIRMKVFAAAKYRYSYILAICALLLLCTNCISPYEPQIQGENGVLVVDGSLIKGHEKQVVMISETAPISQPVFLPVEKCQVRIADNTGNEFVFSEESPGKYVANIDDAQLDYNKQYKLMFTTSSGDDYESDYQVLLETAPVDSLYFKSEYRYSSATGKETTSGLQFYVDLDAPNDASRYYRWVLEETWEEHSKSEIWAVYDGQKIKPFYPRDSLYRCWVTGNVTGLYAASTINLSENRIKKVPLHFLESNSSKLSIKYCATVSQYALNEDAYDYWYEKERELNESGNIYTIQPSQPKSNIHNINHADEKVLGFFWVASLTQKHVFAHVNNDPTETGSCSSVAVYYETEDFDKVSPLLYAALSAFADLLPDPPIYIALEHGTNYNIILTPGCVDCRANGGEARKPDFWE
jgi:hypothetical protein